MKINSLGINGAWVATSSVHVDERGNFREWFKRTEILTVTGIDFSTEQANTSVSNRGVIRGIHYSIAAKGQAKWVTCTSGAIIDVVVDIRTSSPTFGQVEYVDLKASEGRAVLIGPELGHGFISLEEGTTVSYLLSSPYMPEFEYEINPTDAALNINWHLELSGGIGYVMSPKDAQAPTLEERRAAGQLPDSRGEQHL
jgi:dTDP-4-dehydrorhamnose 3,5-epimerase